MKTFFFSLFLITGLKATMGVEKYSDRVQEAAAALKQCGVQHGFDENKRKVMQEIFSQDVFPEDNHEFVEYHGCAWKLLGLQDNNGDINYDLHVEFSPDHIKTRFGEVPNRKELSVAARNHCGNTPKGDTDALTVIKYRNCIRNYLKDVIQP